MVIVSSARFNYTNKQMSGFRITPHRITGLHRVERFQELLAYFKGSVRSETGKRQSKGGITNKLREIASHCPATGSGELRLETVLLNLISVNNVTNRVAI